MSGSGDRFPPPDPTYRPAPPPSAPAGQGQRQRGWGAPPPQPASPGPGWQQPGSGGAGWPTPPAAEPSPPRRRRWPIVLVIVLVVLGGCGAAATFVGFRVFGGMTAPIDTANELLDAARAGGDAGPHACAGEFQPGNLASTQGQQLTSVNITNNRVATVEGTITLESGTSTLVVVTLNRRADDSWCVSGVRY